jgi:hypothetical protein
VDLAPFTLGAGQHIELKITFDVLDCATVPGMAGGRQTVTTAPVIYRVLGITRTVDVPLGYAFSIESLPSCP